jgi:hypothetical protein
MENKKSPFEGGFRGMFELLKGDVKFHETQ